MKETSLKLLCIILFHAYDMLKRQKNRDDKQINFFKEILKKEELH
jgi:hypothetical protein